MRSLSKLALPALAALILSCGAPDHKLNLVMIGVDTLRPDHLGCYGYRSETSPSIDRLAEGGVLFENVVSQSPSTLPSFATVFTSLYPTQHGAGGLPARAGGPFGNRISPSFPPLAMMLLKKGYSTGAVINAPALGTEFGVDRGFEYYSCKPGWIKRSAESTTQDALQWIDQNRSHPFFMFVNYFDPNMDYDPPAPYDTMFDPDYAGGMGNSLTVEDYDRMKEELSRENDSHAAREWDHIKALYDGEIRFTDKAVGDLLAGLEGMGLTDNTLIVLLSDHGEEFLEHGGFEHGHALYQELISVPLVFSLPRKLPRGLRIRQQVRSLDILPTILDVLGIQPWTRLEGASLMPLVTGEGKVESLPGSLLPARFAYSEGILKGTEKKGLTVYPWKYVFDTVTGDETLFNLEDDPGESVDLVDRDREAADRFGEMVLKTRLAVSESWHVEIAGGGEPHTFDIAIGVPHEAVDGNITMHAFLGPDGDVLPDGRIPLTEISNKAIRIEGLEIDGEPLTLAFKVSPGMVPVEFDIEVDGSPARNITYLGQDLAKPAEMPFRQAAVSSDPTSGVPGSKPDPPYVLVVRAPAMFAGGTEVEGGEDR